MKIANYIEMFCTWSLLLLFEYAGISKLRDFDTFQVQLSQSPFTTWFATPLSWSLPFVEIVTTGLLFFKRTRIIGLYIALFLMSVFTSYIFTMLHYSFYIPCSCGGILGHLDWTIHFWFNLGFVLIAIAGIKSKEMVKSTVQAQSYTYNSTNNEKA